jgi:hypothetical protein
MLKSVSSFATDVLMIGKYEDANRLLDFRFPCARLVVHTDVDVVHIIPTQAEFRCTYINSLMVIMVGNCDDATQLLDFNALYSF